MKKLFLILSVAFLMSCGATKSREIKQSVVFDNINNTCLVTTYFDLPTTYNSYVKCDKIRLDSVKVAEINKAEEIQQKME